MLRWTFWIVPVFAVIAVIGPIIAHFRSFPEAPVNVLLEIVIPAVVGLSIGTAIVLPHALWVGRLDRIHQLNPDAVVAPILDTRRTVGEICALLGAQQSIHSRSVALVANGQGIAFWSISSTPAVVIMADWRLIGRVTSGLWTGRAMFFSQTIAPRPVLCVEIDGTVISVIAIPPVPFVSAIRARPDEADMIAFTAAVTAKRPKP